MEHLLNEFETQGWIVLDLPDKNPIFKARDLLQKELNSLTSKTIPLEEYHNLAENDEYHTDMQYKLTAFFRQERFAYKIISAQVDFFKKFIGNDLFVQKNPYLRMTRPLKPQDNIGYHRDTFYGGSPYELSVLVPFVELNEKNSLSVMNGSHTLSEKLFPTDRIENPDKSVVKGSQKHQMGFLYAPKLMDPAVREKMKPIPLKLGQVLIFSLSTVHGSIVNESNRTRWSSDMRVLNALAPVDLSARPEYYEPLCFSPVTRSAQKYFKNNESQ